MTEETKQPFDSDTPAQPVQPGMTGTSNEGISPEGRFSSEDSVTETVEPTADIEGASLKQDDETTQTGGFVGSDSQSDTSSELVEDDDQLQAPDGQ